MNKSLIGLCGSAGSGKNTVAEFLSSNYGYRIASVGKRLKDTISVLFNIDRNLLEGITEEGRIWRETPLKFWSEELGRDMTPRQLLQEVGEGMKDFHANIWLLSLKHEIESMPDVSWAISDIRFPNEIDFIKEMGGELWQVRKTLPEWYQKAVADNLHGTTYMKQYKNIHVSEWRWMMPDDYYDRIIMNTGTLEDLNVEVSRQM